MLIVEAKSAVRPKAIPSNMLWVERARSRTRDLMALQVQVHWQRGFLALLGSMADWVSVTRPRES